MITILKLVDSLFANPNRFATTKILVSYSQDQCTFIILFILKHLPYQFSLALVPCDEIYKKKEEVGEDENSNKVLGAAKASRVNKSRPVYYFVRRVATSSRATLYSAI